MIGVDGDGMRGPSVSWTRWRAHRLRRVFLSGGVHPEWRRAGYRRAVLRWQTERAREVLAEQERRDPGVGELPWRIRSTTARRSTIAPRCAKRLGTPRSVGSMRCCDPLGADAPPISDVSVPSELEVAPWTEDLDELVRGATTTRSPDTGARSRATRTCGRGSRSGTGRSAVIGPAWC